MWKTALLCKRRTSLTIRHRMTCCIEINVRLSLRLRCLPHTHNAPRWSVSDHKSSCVAIIAVCRTIHFHAPRRQIISYLIITTTTSTAHAALCAILNPHALGIIRKTITHAPSCLGLLTGLPFRLLTQVPQNLLTALRDSHFL